MNTRRKRWVLGLAVGVIVLIATDQAFQLIALSDGEFFGRRVIPFDPPLFTPSQREAVERVRDHVKNGTPLTGQDFDGLLGWVPPKETDQGMYAFDWSGARIAETPLAREKQPGIKRIAAMGCSFTFGAEVKSTDCWAARLDALPQIEVANLGVGAYGLDQALLRFERDAVPLKPDEVWLGYLPSASLRVMTTYLTGMRHWAWAPAFKPRFEIDDANRLTLVESPARNPAEFVALFDSQQRFFDAVRDHDLWVKRLPVAWSPFGSSFLHRSGFARIALTFHEKSGREAKPWIVDEKSECHRLIREIALRMKRETEASGARFRLIVLPDELDLVDREENGKTYWSGLVDAWKVAGMEVFDLTESFRAVHGATNEAMWAPEGHYSPEGNRVVADALARYLESAR